MVNCDTGLHREWRDVALMTYPQLRLEAQETLSSAHHELRLDNLQSAGEYIGRGFEIDAEIRRRARGQVNNPHP